MMLKVKSKAKQDVGLTVPVATRQARRIVDQVMPGVGATVESKRSYDLAADVCTIVTTITFPSNDLRGYDLYLALATLAGQCASIRVGSASYVITRKVK